MIRVHLATQSYFGSRGANLIQVNEMARAFAEIGAQTTWSLRRLPGASFAIRPEPSAILVPQDGKSRWSRLAATLGEFRWWILKYFGRRHIVVTRNAIFAVLARIGGCTRVFLELHSAPRSGLEWNVISILGKLRVRFICISRALSDVVSDAIAPAIPMVLHDGHSTTCVESQGRSEGGNGRLKIGYFGGIAKQKGMDLLLSLIEKCPEHYFAIFSKDHHLIPAYPNISECRYASHDEVLKEMGSCDVLLMLIEPQGGVDDISPYTSPLKLFEYMSVGGAILASDVPVLWEVIDQDCAVLTKNSFPAMRDALARLQDRDLRQKIGTNARLRSRQFTWTRRAGRILLACKPN